MQKNESKKKKKNAPWIRPRHTLVRNIAELVLYPFVRLLYGARIEKFAEQGKRQYLILMNHQTDFDQFFVGLAFRGPVYYVASEDLFSNGLISDLLRYLVAPIPIKKQTTDPRAVINCIKVAREGGTIAMAPEGNRTYHGRNVYIKPSVVPLAKKLGLPIAIFKIEGGYGVHPRWSDVIRGGEIRCGVSRVIEPEEYLALTDGEMYRLLISELSVDETKNESSYPHKRNAEFLERALYTCPNCGFARLESRGNKIKCLECGMEVTHHENKQLSSENVNFNFRFVADWYDWQESFVSALKLENAKNEPYFTDKVNFLEVIPYKKKQLIKKDALLELYMDKIRLDSEDYPFTAITGVTVLGKNKLNIYMNGQIYQCKGDKRFCALKYVNLFTHYKNLTEDSSEVEKEKPHEYEFLGL